MHSLVEEDTQKKYRRIYPRLDADLRTLRENPGLLTLLVDNLVDLDLIFKDVKPSLDVVKEDVETTIQLIGSGPVNSSRAS